MKKEEKNTFIVSVVIDFTTKLRGLNVQLTWEMFFFILRWISHKALCREVLMHCKLVTKVWLTHIIPFLDVLRMGSSVFLLWMVCFTSTKAHLKQTISIVNKSC